jgi:hypothetical protein
MQWLQIASVGLWPLVWHFGLAGLLLLGCAAGAVYAPTIKSKLWFVAIGAIIATFSVAVAIGVTLGEKRVRAQWDAANTAAIERGNQAHDNAVRTVRRKPTRWMPNKRDAHNRDRS